MSAEMGVFPPIRGEVVDQPKSKESESVGKFSDRYGGNVWNSAGEWIETDAEIVGSDGKAIFEQHGIKAPKSWSALAIRVVAQKYFRGVVGSESRENSIRDLIDRVVTTICKWGKADGYFESDEEASGFRNDLIYLLLNQCASFNSPVWFNVGVEKNPQCSACFIQSVDDSMESILDLAKHEGMLFKYGSGTGSNFSKLRGKNEGLAGGGGASGPVSFMKGFDAFAGVIKSGGKTRRAAKIVILDADHPDIMEFIDSKIVEEGKARALINAGYEGGIDGEAYRSVFFQNANHSIRVADEFMNAVENDEMWTLTARTNGSALEKVSAREIFEKIVKNSHECGDPGLQFDTTINSWNPTPNAGRINGSNPCSEFMYVDDSACNLASLNLRKFQRGDGSLDTQSLINAVEVIFKAQEILIDRASYPTPEIEKNSKALRPIGIGFANLGAFLMSTGLAYDSNEGRSTAAFIAATIQGAAAKTSADISKRMGPFQGYSKNSEAYISIMERHQKAFSEINMSDVPLKDAELVSELWADSIKLGTDYGFRNGQLSVVAPTGTIAFMMDCDTTGIEPDIALRKTKALVGGGSITYVNQSVTSALKLLGYSESEIGSIWNHVKDTGSVEGSKIKNEHLPVFDCAFPTSKGGRSIHWRGHIRMMAVVQPFVSGAISKTVNFPSDATVDDVEAAYLTAWELGVKAIAIYRDGSKAFQPIETKEKSEKPSNGNGSSKPIGFEPAEVITIPTGRERREKLSNTRQSVTHKIDVAGHEGYLTVGLYDDGRVGEIFVRMAKEGSTISGLMDAFATSISIALQYGVPLSAMVEKFSQTRFEPSGFSGEMGYCTSILDYIFRWLDKNYPGGRKVTVVDDDSKEANIIEGFMKSEISKETKRIMGFDSGPPCSACGSMMEPNGSCHRCANCGGTSGCS